MSSQVTEGLVMLFKHWVGCMSSYGKDKVDLQTYMYIFSLKVPTKILTLKVSATTAADDIYKYFFSCFSEKMRLDTSCEFSARPRMHLKHQALFP